MKITVISFYRKKVSRGFERYDLLEG